MNSILQISLDLCLIEGSSHRTDWFKGVDKKVIVDKDLLDGMDAHIGFIDSCLKLSELVWKTQDECAPDKSCIVGEAVDVVHETEEC